MASYVCTTSDGRTPCVYARKNGFGATSSDTVTLSYPATVSGAALSSAAVPAFTVTVQRTLNNGLIRFVGGPATSRITAKATAGLTGTVSSDCIYVLDPSAKNAFQATGSANVTVSGCAITINSTDSDAMTVSGTSNVSASAIYVAGGDTLGASTTTTPAPITGKAAVADPLASLPALAVGACDYTNYSSGAGTWTLSPGVYCGGISLHNSAIATFNPGTYIINGGGVAFGGAAIATGNGVMFYLTGTNATYGSLTIGNSANVTLSALTSGPYLGVLFFQDRSITSVSNAAVQRGRYRFADRDSVFSDNVRFVRGIGRGRQRHGDRREPGCIYGRCKHAPRFDRIEDRSFYKCSGTGAIIQIER